MLSVKQYYSKQSRLKLTAKETLQCKRINYRPQIRLQIDQMSIKIESSRNITNMSAIAYRPQSPTSNGNERLCVRLQIDQMSIII